MRKPLITKVSLDPVRDGEVAGPCEICNGIARWIAGRPDQTRFFCAHCFLYETDGGIENVGRLEELVGDVEKQMGCSISKDGKVTREHSDRILSSIVMVTRMIKARKNMMPREAR